MPAGRWRQLQAELATRARVAPPPDWLPLALAGQRCGRVDPRALPVLCALPAFALCNGELALQDPASDFDTLSRHLRAAALALRDAGLLLAWRDELLEVKPKPDAPALAVIERAACRALGITTYAVHVNGFLPDGSLVVCRRSAHKSVDPGLWDNLAAGMIAAGESELVALAREAQEEAGLNVAGIECTRGSSIDVCRPVGEGHMFEWVQVYDLELPPGVVLRNQDGEVQAIEVRAPWAVLEAIEAGEFTLEAALATLDAFERRGLLDRVPAW